MDIMTHAKFYFNRLMLTLIFAIRASEPPPRAWRTTKKAGPDRVKPRLIWIRARGWLGDSKPVRRQVTWAELAVLEAFLSVVVPMDKFAGAR